MTSQSPADSAESTPGSGDCRVFVCDDQADIRQALTEIIDRIPGFEKVGEAADGVALLEALRTTRTDLIILDVSMPHGGPPLAREIKSIRPEVKIVVFTAHRDGETKDQMLAAGVDDFVVKTGRLRPLREALERVARDAPVQ